MTSSERSGFRPALKKHDLALYLALALLLFIAAVMNAALARRSGEGLSVEAVRDGAVVLSEPLGKIAGSSVVLRGPDGFNEITADGGVRMTSADCPGGDCLRTGEIKRPGGVIVCVPHKLTVRLVSALEPDIDAVTF